MTLQAEHLVVARNGRIVLDHVSLRLTEGTITVILGPNGAGKSTLLLTLAGLLAPAQGLVRIGGENVHKMPPSARASKIAWRETPAEASFALTVRDRLALAGSRPDAEIVRAAACFDLAEKLDAPLATLSLGERYRAELASLIVQDAPVWLLDEPTAHLDPAHVAQCLDWLRAEARKGRTIAVVLHDLYQAQAIAHQYV
ncbi:MAG: ABC transporter ATP-binding protein, partial [Zetaproteobacteria bacterium]